MASLEVIRAFISSPGDLKDERLAAREVVERVNTYVGNPLGLRIELYGWEVQPPGFGRPQAQINAEVDEAELFVGILWRRWGTPSSDDHSSGFEEEYGRALKRREAGDHPAVWLFFKDVEEGQLNDPGTELQKVLDFRRGIEARREVLYRTFSDEEDWRTQLHDFLSNFLTKRASEARAFAEPDRSLPASTASAAGPAAADAGSPSDSGDNNPALAQLVGSIDVARTHLTHEAGSQIPPEFDAARLLLASFSWLSNHRTSEVLDTHEVNVLYRMRDTLEPQALERFQLVRSLITGGEVRPGWLWAASFPKTPTAFALGYLARTDPNEEVRAAAVTLLHDAGTLANAIPDDIEDEAWQRVPFLRAIADDHSDQVRAAAMDMLGRDASDEAVELLEAARASGRSKESAVQGLLRAHLQRDPSAALRLLQVERPFINDDLASAIIQHAAEFDEATVDALRDGRTADHRKLALRIDADAGRLTEAVARTALTDKSYEVRALAVDLMHEHGWQVEQDAFDEALEGRPGHLMFLGKDKEDEREVRQLRTWDPDELAAEANWYSVGSGGHYEALGRQYFVKYGAQVRRDLSEDFETFKQESADAVQARFPGLDVSELLTESKYTRQLFKLAALRVLGEHGTHDDAPTVRRYLADDEGEVRVEAIRVLARIGGAEDAPSALELSKEAASRRVKGSEVARIALSLDSSLAPALAESDVTAVAKVGIRALTSANVDLLRALLGSETPQVRVAAVARLSRLLSETELRDLLEDYLATSAFYYYNVVCWLDRLVYAPEPFLTRYRSQLDAALNA